MKNIEDGYVVEFKFDITKDNHWQFIPIRVRHDKTYAYKQEIKVEMIIKLQIVFGDRYIIQLQIKCYITQKIYQIYKI